MAEFQVRSDAVDVEQIMRQIRSRIREKRGADYTEQEIQELANVKLEKFLDPRGIRSNLVQEFRKNRVITPAPPALTVGNVDIFGSSRPMLRAIRKLLNPILRLFVSPTPLVQALQSLQIQNEVNTEFHRRFRQREEMDPLYYEVTHNLVVELTRLAIENQNLKMKVESLSSRMDFDERRARALETVVAYKPAPRPERIERPAPSERSESRGPDRSERNDAPRPERNVMSEPRAAAEGATPAQPGGDPQRAGLEPRDQGERGERRRRRRRRRRPGQNNAQGGPGGPGSNVQSSVQGSVQGPGSGPTSGPTSGSESGGDGGNNYGGGDNGGDDHDSGSDE